MKGRKITEPKKSPASQLKLLPQQRKELEAIISKYVARSSLELEASFKQVTLPQYNAVLQHLASLVEEDGISACDVLDVSISLPENNIYRVSIKDMENINEFVKANFGINNEKLKDKLQNMNTNDNVDIMYKERGNAIKLFLEDYGVLVKLTREIPVSEKNKPTIKIKSQLTFRSKSRFSFQITDNFRIDVTKVLQSKELRHLTNTRATYEIEIEATGDAQIDELLQHIEDMLRVIQDSDTVISKSESQTIINEYAKMMGNPQSQYLENRNVTSISPIAVYKHIPNKYAVTDKADGERYFLFVFNSDCYFISVNKIVKKTSMRVTCENYTNMVVDGELIVAQGRRIYLIFDVLYANGVDYRYTEKYNLAARIQVINTIVDKCFGNLIEYQDYPFKQQDLTLENIKEFTGKQLTKYWRDFGTALAKHAGIFVSKKLYFVPYGVSESEIFMYADLIWRQYTLGQLVPYLLDGIIYTPINAPYISRGENAATEYKWKPASLNSIDFYIKFSKDHLGNDELFYDKKGDQASVYAIANLYVGVRKGGQEFPMSFKINGNAQRAYLPIVESEILDAAGEIIVGDSVVEFVYDDTPSEQDDAFRWRALRTRHDKTESVRMHGKKYGNYVTIAQNIWLTIKNPISQATIASLANPNTYTIEQKLLAGNAPTTTNSSVYYEKKTNDACGMRAYNNWVKSSMISTYCDGKKTALDVGCGRGGDLIKFANTSIRKYVGIDIDNAGLYVISDSAQSRYQNLRKNNKNMPEMHFIHADARAHFTVAAQASVVPSMDTRNKQRIQQHLEGQQFDVINAQFTLHYYMSDKTSWSNFCENINNHLADNGYLLVTAFDGKLIHDKMQGTNKLCANYTNDEGKSVDFFEIRKVYSDTDCKGTGMTIHFYNSLISSPGKFMPEYLVHPEFLQQSLAEKCGLELVETDTFYGIFNTYRNFFKNGSHHDTNISARKFQDIQNFYQTVLDPDANTIKRNETMASFKLSMLNRYYIFRKPDGANMSRILPINQRINLGKVMRPYFKRHDLHVNTKMGRASANDLFLSMRDDIPQIQPSIYMIREKGTPANTKLDFTCIQKADTRNMMLMYKALDKTVYPVYVKTDNGNEFIHKSSHIIKLTGIQVAQQNMIQRRQSRRQK